MEMNEAEETGTSDLVLRLSKRVKTTPVKGNLNLLSSTSMTKYKGVVQQQNGHWGAQIYADHKRIWLGTFKTCAEAAMAYDSASIKLRNGDINSHRNFPWSDYTIHEPNFQECYTTEAVLTMIRDGSYQHKFKDFLRIRSQIVASINTIGPKQTQEGKEGRKDQDSSDQWFTCTQLFQKELTPSDVGKLNRLVIPKKYAVKYLPYISETETETETEAAGAAGGGSVEDVELVFYDRAMRQWKFRYCYWKSSQSFVFTRGWNGFVKEKNLKEKDVIVFYNCDVTSNMNRLENQTKKFLMIDVHYFTENGFVVAEEVNRMVCESTGEVKSKVEDEETKESTEEAITDEKNKGFMLFGVRIIQ